jgi:hypothetical protein
MKRSTRHLAIVFCIHNIGSQFNFVANQVFTGLDFGTDSLPCSMATMRIYRNQDSVQNVSAAAGYARGHATRANIFVVALKDGIFLVDFGIGVN